MEGMWRIETMLVLKGYQLAFARKGDIAWDRPDRAGRQAGGSSHRPPTGEGKDQPGPKLIAGIEKPDSGKILLDGRLINNLDVTERAKIGIAYAFQQPVRFKGLLVRDLMELASGRSLSEEELCDSLSQVGLCAREYIDREVSASLSGGEIKRIEIATVLARPGQAHGVRRARGRH